MDDGEFEERFRRSRGEGDQPPPLSQALVGTGLLMRQLGRLMSFLCVFGVPILLALAIIGSTPLLYVLLSFGGAVGGLMVRGIGDAIGIKGLQRARARGDVIAMSGGFYDPEAGYVAYGRFDPGPKFLIATQGSETHSEWEADTGERIEKSEKKISCPDCGRRFVLGRDLEQHRATKHRISLS